MGNNTTLTYGVKRNNPTYMSLYKEARGEELLRKKREQNKEYRLLNREKCHAYAKKYQEEHRDEIVEYRKKRSEKHKIYMKEYLKKLRKEKPWIFHFKCAKERCNPKNGKRYYSTRGIKMLMTQEEFEHLWFRDEAFKMKRPSIDRIDNFGNYELKNCRFLEFSENMARRFKNVRS